MRGTMLIMATVMVLVACLYGTDNTMHEVYMTKPLNRAMPQKAPFELELKYARNGVPGTPLGPENAPWSAAVNASTGNATDPDRDIHLRHGSNGSIWLGWDANTGDYSVAIAVSNDNGATWDERYYGSGTNTFQYAALSLTDAGYLKLWSTITTTGYNNDILWLQSLDGFPNDIDNLDGWYWFGAGAASYYHEPEAVATLGTGFGSGLEVVVWTNKTPDPGADIDSVEIWWTDFGMDSGYSYVNLGSADGVHQLHPTCAICVPGDTFRMIAFEEDSLVSGYYNVNFWRIDSIGASVWFHGWATYHFGGSRCPTLAGEGDYAYAAYEIFDGEQWDILFDYSIDAGDNWSGTFAYVANTVDDERHPRLTSAGQRVGITYTYNGGTVTNRFNSSDANGASGTWGTEEIVTDATSTEDNYRCVDVMWYSGNNSWYAAWTDTRSGATDVYTSYKAAGTSQIITIPATPDSFIYFDYSSKLRFNSYITKYCEKVYDPVLSVNMERAMEEAEEGALIGVLITMRPQITADWLLASAAPLKRREKAKFVGRELKAFADETQADLLAYLARKEREGKAKDYGSIFTGNRVYAHVTRDVILEIAQRDDVGWLMPEVPHILADANYGGYGEEVAEPRSVEGHVTAINADDVWDTGYAGQGIIVGVMDTGANIYHNDLSDHLWTGNGNYPNGGWDFENGDNVPEDDDGHGSFTCGVVCGDGTNGDTTGVAPECSLMILRTAYNTHMHSAVDFAILGGRAGVYGEPADVFQASVGFERGQFGTDAEWQNMKNEFRPDAADMLAAGILWTYAAGNGNSYTGGHYDAPDDIIVAANCPPPWLHPDQSPTGGVSATVAVGACTNARSRTSWSSYGPAEWYNGTYNDYRYEPMLGMGGLLKPDIMAPGSNLTSLAMTGQGYASGWSGTSFAAPCLAGACALILSKDFSLTPARLDSLVENTTLPVTSYNPAGKDSLNGSGFLDVQAACLGIGNAQKGILRVINDPLATGNLLVSTITHNQPWVVKVEPTSFTVSPGDTQLVDVWADTTGFGLGPSGDYYDTLFIESNSESKATTIVEVWLHMGPLNLSMTTLTATGYVGRIELNWRTASEYNLEAWQVTRSGAAEGDYTIIGALEGHGTTGLPNDYQFVDNGVEPGKHYYYKIVAIDNMGKTTYGPISAAALVGPSVNGLRLAMNPARSPKVLFTVSNPSKVSLRIYDLTGRLVRTLAHGVMSPNNYSLVWDGRNDVGGYAGNGVYFIRMSSDGEEATLKLTLLK